LLHAGRNVMAAVVWNYSTDAPMAQVTHETGFLLQGDTAAEALVDTDKSWRAIRNDAISLVAIDRASIGYAYYVAGPGEEVRGDQYPWGWQRPDLDDGSWGRVDEIAPASPRGIRDSPSRWFLVSRSIPPMAEQAGGFERVARAIGPTPPDGFLQGRGRWPLPARSTSTLLLDAGHLTTAYPEIMTSGGKGSSITLTYTEALHAVGTGGRPGEKGNRNEVEGKVAAGLRDRFLPDGGESRLFRPLWWRTFRYVEMTIQTADEPLTIDALGGSTSAYPFEEKGRFTSSDPVLSRIWQVGWRTARLCAHETYMDTPYWEQLQYVGDTRIQALLSLYVAGDDRLVRNAIELYDESRIVDGLTQSRYPTMLPQIIPPFSLSWIGMLHDLQRWGGDTAFSGRYLRGAAGVLAWFEARIGPSGLLGPLEWWNFVDWVEGHGFENGEPPSDDGGSSAILSLQYVLALREAADLEFAAGHPEMAAAYRARADRVAAAVKAATWDAGRGLFADTPSRRTFSQHVNVLAILADLLPPAEARTLMRRVLDDRSLTGATYYFQFYVFRAMRHAGLGDEYLSRLQPWRDMLALGLTTWAETPEPTRSDSHAWSAHPNYDLLTTVAGVTPGTPGFATVRIEPHLGALSAVDATVATPRGPVKVGYTRAGTQLQADVTLPEGVTGTLVWGGSERPLRSGDQRVTAGPGAN
jgi:alpha-L-rhamnosidase